jgi:hypothetical protein
VRPALASALVALLVAAAAAAATPRSIVSPAPVAALAADGNYVAFAASPAARDCDRIRIWNRATGRVIALGKTTGCEVTSTGHGIAQLAAAGKRVLWLHYVGGNTREYTIFTATTTSRRPRRVAFGSADVETPPPLVVGPGDASPAGDLLPFAVGSQVIALTASGRRSFEWTAPRLVRAVGARGGALAVALADGRVARFDRATSTAPDAIWTGSPAAHRVFVNGTGVVAQRGTRVELRAADGAISTRQLPAGAQVTDAVGSRVVYVLRGTVRNLDMALGTERTLARGTAAELEPRLVYANGRRVTSLR